MKESTTLWPQRHCAGAGLRSSVATALLGTLLAAGAAGCYSVVSMSKVPPESGTITPSRMQQRLAPAYLKSIQESLDGTRRTGNVEAAFERAHFFGELFERRFIGELQEARVFTDVVSVLGVDRRPPNEEHFDLVLHSDVITHPHTFGNTIKAGLLGGSLFLLTPVLPFVYGYETKMTLSVTSPTGVTKEYVAEAQGTVYCTFDQGVLANLKLYNQVLENSTTSVINQLAHDRVLQQ